MDGTLQALLVCGLNCGLLPAVVRVPAGRSPQFRLVKEQELFTYMTLFLGFSDNFCVFEPPFYLEVLLPLGAFLPAKTLTTKIVREGFLAD